MTFRLMAAGDLHWHKQLRWDECVRVHDFIATTVEAEKPDAFVIPGDIFESESTPEERNAVARFLVRVANVCPVLIAKGNHDVQADLAIFAALRAKYSIVVEERAGVHLVDGRNGMRAAIALVAWPDKASVAAMSGRAVSPEDLDETCRELMRDVLRGLGAELAKHDGPRVLAMHAMVDGSATSTGQPLIGAELRLALADLALAGADFVVMSHIHLPQAWTFDGVPVVYTGSPFRTKWGEVEEKSVVRATFESAGLADWDRVATPARRMLLVTGTYSAETGLDTEVEADGAPASTFFEGAEVRVRYEVDAADQEAARVEADEYKGELLAHGAFDVKVEPRVRAQAIVRAPEIAKAQGIPDKLRALWKTRGVQMTPERDARIMGRLDQLRAEVRR